MWIMTFNMQGGGYDNDSKLSRAMSSNPNSAVPPNIILLQECTKPPHSTPIAQVHGSLFETWTVRFGSAKRGFMYRVLYREWFGPRGGNTRCSMAILWRLPNQEPNIAPDLINGGEFYPLGVPAAASRPVIWTQVPWPGGGVVANRLVFCVHSRPAAYGPIHVQAAAIAPAVVVQRIVGGDFNVNLLALPVPAVPAGWARHSCGAPTHVNGGELDYFSVHPVGAVAHPAAVRSNTLIGGDHLPVFFNWP